MTFVIGLFLCYWTLEKLLIKEILKKDRAPINFSANKSNRPASEQILLAMAMDERMMIACVGQNKSTWWIKTKQPIADSVLMAFCSTNRN